MATKKNLLAKKIYESYLEKGIDISPVPIGMLLVKSLKKNFPNKVNMKFPT